MCVDLKSMFNRDARSFFDVFNGLQHQARGLRQINIRLQKPGAVRTKGAVNLAFYRTDGEEIIAVGRRKIARQPFLHSFVRFTPHHDIKAHGQLTRVF